MSLSDPELAAALAGRAGRLLSRFRTGHTDLPPPELGKAADAHAEGFLARALACFRPADGVLSEEATDDRVRLRRDRVWIVDPLDGTREYAAGRHANWAVHVALWEAGAGLTAAAVAIPDLDLVHSTEAPPPASTGSPVMLVSAGRPPAFAAAVAEALGLDLVGMGSAGAKAMAVVRGEADVYLHAGGQWEWDSAAPAAVAMAAGLHASRIDGSPLRYNKPDPCQPDLLICRPELAERVLDSVTSFRA
ncbi:inositol monophosphatase family protein [Amycolatopsis sp. QT-25]|uniref:inositol monophosphatase family protein n=1 Tax=Amycolatopsis sp. QT-25 TaxID=3034022 RepID=UPI0023EBD107|nr:inositol monophosphatase family protein [Amycolatopsis sp. QT-25]WET81842.1 inositol monophosphatase family protein [Amycolatopsis sp. QT-25]